MRKKILSILLSVCMMLTLLPTVAFAAEATTDFGDFSVTYDGTAPSYDSNTLTLGSGTYTISGTTTADKIVVASGTIANVTLSGVNIDVSGTAACAFDMTGAKVTLTLAEGSSNVLKSSTAKAGLYVPDGAELTINGTGSLNAVSTSQGAGIGGDGTNKAAGSITIDGGTVTASSFNGAGIGGGGVSDGGGGIGGSITINGGTVSASSYHGAGIGGGYGGNAGGGSGGTISITGGTVNASSTNSPGIGGSSGYSANTGGNGGTISITGGTVNASSTDNTGLGRGGCGTNGTISITGGTVTATGGSFWAAMSPAPTLGSGATVTAMTADEETGSLTPVTYYENDIENYQYLQITLAVQAQWGVAGSNGAEPTTWVNSGTLDDAMTYANSNTGTYIQLLTDIDKDNHTAWPLTFSQGKTTILDLNGKDINRGLTTATANGNVITANGNLTIKDSSTADVSKQGCITGGYNSDDTGGGVYVYSIFTLQGGNITGNKTTNSGGGVSIRIYCTFYMQGGSVADNEAAVSGGGVYAPNGTFNMEGGSVTGNKSANGGVYVNGQFRAGGSVVVKGNILTASSVERNAVIPTGKQIFVHPSLVSGASIGVTAESVPTVGSPIVVANSMSNDYSGYFFSDNSSYLIQKGASNTVQLAVSPPTIGTLAISDTFTAGSNLTLSELDSKYKPTITANGVEITEQGWQTPDGSGGWTNWSMGVLPLDTSSTFKLRYYATYLGGTVTSNEVTLTVVGNATALALTAAPASPQSAGSSVTLTATLTGFFTKVGVDTQRITLKIGGETLGKATLNADGVATYTWMPSTAGTYSLTAEYGSTNYNAAATSNTVSYTVQVALDPDAQAVSAAKAAAENASYAAMTQAAAPNETAINAALKSVAVTAVNNGDITITINKVAYTVPIAGTSENPSGTEGSYTFTVTVSKGSQSETTGQKTITITATPYTGGTGGGSSNGGGSTTPPSTKPTEPVTGSTQNKATVDNKGNASVSLTDKNITDAIADAKAEAAKKGVNAGDITAVIHVTTDGKTANTVTVNLPKTTQEQVIGNKIASVQLVIDRPDLTIGIDLAAVTEINRQATADVQLSATRMDNTKLSGDAKAAIGNRPTYDLKALYGSGKSVTDFGKGSVSVEIPYTLQKGEIAGNVYAVYVDAKGKVTYLTDSSYDAKRGTVVFSTSHFSTYGIAYKASFKFTDINGHWAKDDILFVANRGLMTGTSATTFSPNGSMTRGMFVTALGRLANADTSAYKQSSFTDVKAYAYYMGYIEWGVKNNILVGIGGGKFNPDGLVTREQMAVIMDRYATAIGFKLPEVHTQNAFADNAKIGAWAAPSVKRIQMAGIIQGKSKNLYDPQGTATRAEVSAVLRRFVEPAIFSDTAQGWSMNDSVHTSP